MQVSLYGPRLPNSCQWINEIISISESGKPRQESGSISERTGGGICSAERITAGPFAEDLDERCDIKVGTRYWYQFHWISLTGTRTQTVGRRLASLHLGYQRSQGAALEGRSLLHGSSTP